MRKKVSGTAADTEDSDKDKQILNNSSVTNKTIN